MVEKIYDGLSNLDIVFADNILKKIEDNIDLYFNSYGITEIEILKYLVTIDDIGDKYCSVELKYNGFVINKRDFEILKGMMAIENFSFEFVYSKHRDLNINMNEKLYDFFTLVFDRIIC